MVYSCTHRANGDTAYVLGANIGKYYIYANNAREGHNWPRNSAEVLTSSKQALSGSLLCLQKQVAVEKIVGKLFRKDLIERKGTEFAPLGRHPSMVIGSEQSWLRVILLQDRAHLSEGIHNIK